MPHDVTIVVSSCDAYSDCWDPFFKLFETYWPDCPYPVVLVSDTLSYQGESKRVKTFAACKESGRAKLAWGGCMIECLRRLSSPTIIYLQEDHFLERAVNQDQVVEFADFISKMSWTHERTMHIGLCPRSSHGPFHLTEHPLLWEVDRQARYRFSLQPGLWNREDLLQFLRYRDSPWLFEETSHIRGRRVPNRVLTLNRHVFGPQGRLVYPFEPGGGIVQGKWVRASVAGLFQQHGIDVDLSLRGCREDDAASACRAPFLRDRLQLRLDGLRGRINEVIDRFRY